jgi:broad specificity phosphatase PhoE
MNESIKLIFVRHGESEKNISHIKSRAVDKYPLTLKGIEQVEEIANKINEEVDLIISSPVLRCRQTAEMLSKKFKIKVIYNELVSEYNSGEWDEVTREELLKMKSYQDYSKIKSDPQKRFCFRMGKSGETREEIISRVAKFINQVVNKYLGKTIIVVSHAGINAGINKALGGINIDEFFKQESMDYSDIFTFLIDDQGKLLEYKKY